MYKNTILRAYGTKREASMQATIVTTTNVILIKSPHENRKVSTALNIYKYE
jgi:hypothetical protein